MATSIAPNKRLDQIYSYVQGLTDEQLAQLVQKNPESTEATLALGQIQSRNDFRQRAQGQQGETPTVKENVLSSGLPSVMPQQNNQDPRLMAGMRRQYVRDTKRLYKYPYEWGCITPYTTNANG